MTIPTVGRICHYTNLGDRDGKYPPEALAALITKVEGPRVGGGDVQHEEERYRVTLHIFYATGQFDRADVPFTAEPAGSEAARGAWSWPARV